MPEEKEKKKRVKKETVCCECLQVIEQRKDRVSFDMGEYSVWLHIRCVSLMKKFKEQFRDKK